MGIVSSTGLVDLRLKNVIYGLNFHVIYLNYHHSFVIAGSFSCYYLTKYFFSPGNLPHIFSRTGTVPSVDGNGVGNVGDGVKPCCGCLGRDTIANAAAMVGPAVVNISVPQGMLSDN